MSNGNVNSHVPEIQLKASGRIEIQVEVVGFTDQKPAEISGYVMASNGDFVPFYVIRKVHAPAAGGNPVVPVSVEWKQLTPGVDLTVITRVAEVWVTELGADTPRQGDTARWTARYPAGQGGTGQTSWTLKAAAEASESSATPPQSSPTPPEPSATPPTGSSAL